MKEKTFKYLKNLKIFLWKKIRFRLRWDSSPDLTIAGRLQKFQTQLINLKKHYFSWKKIYPFHFISFDVKDQIIFVKQKPN